MADYSTIITNWIKNNYGDSGVIDWTAEPEIDVRIYTRTPFFSETLSTSFAGLESIDDLSDRPEWVLAQATTSRVNAVPTTFYVSETITDGVSYLTLTDGTETVVIEDQAGWEFSPTAPSTTVQEIISAAVFFLPGTYGTVTDPILFATIQGIGESTVAHEGALYGQSSTLVDPPYIFSAKITDGVITTTGSGSLLLLPALPDWESSHAHHLWLEPQRTNFIANPSFEDNGPYGWRSNDVLATVLGGSGGPDRPYCGHVSGSETVKILESNYFPGTDSGAFSIHFSFCADVACTLRYGLVSFGNSYTTATFLRSGEIKVPAGTAVIEGEDTVRRGFTHVTGLVPVSPFANEFCFRVEVTGCDDFWIDNVLVDPTIVDTNASQRGQIVYFDGNSTDGLPDDFRWMGGSSYENRHFSVWYNNYYNTRQRLMGDYDTTDDAYKPGLVEEWSPSGSNIIDHWDSVTSFTPLNWIGNAFYPLSDVNGTPTTTITTTQTVININ